MSDECEENEFESPDAEEALAEHSDAEELSCGTGAKTPCFSAGIQRRL